MNKYEHLARNDHALILFVYLIRSRFSLALAQILKMSEVLLPVRLCPTGPETHGRVLDVDGVDRDDCDLSDSESSSDSSANEYAEGLGFADRRRTLPEDRSSFEFDHHPREEYFEEPRSVRDGETLRCFIAQPRDSKRPISSVLRELEAAWSSENGCESKCVKMSLGNWIHS